MSQPQGTPVKIRRLLPGDQFRRGDSETVYLVFGRFVDHVINVRIEHERRPHDNLHPCVRSGRVGAKEYLEITTTPNRVLAGMIFVDMATGLGYEDVSGTPIEGFKLEDTVTLITPL
ncbi:hypothetical protein D3C81_666240 [compost metagenome]